MIVLGGYFAKGPVNFRLICNGLAARGRRSGKKVFFKRLTPPSDHIYENFEKKSGHAEWSRGALQLILATYFDSSYRLDPLYGGFSNRGQNVGEIC